MPPPEVEPKNESASDPGGTSGGVDSTRAHGWPCGTETIPLPEIELVVLRRIIRSVHSLRPISDDIVIRPVTSSQVFVSAVAQSSVDAMLCARAQRLRLTYSTPISSSPRVCSRSGPEARRETEFWRHKNRPPKLESAKSLAHSAVTATQHALLTVLSQLYGRHRVHFTLPGVASVPGLQRVTLGFEQSGISASKCEGIQALALIVRCRGRAIAPSAPKPLISRPRPVGRGIGARGVRRRA